MELLLTREYWPGGTNGSLLYKREPLCTTVEPPSTCFEPSVSCIPEGIYEIRSLRSPTGSQMEVWRKSSGSNRMLRKEAELGVNQLHRNIVLVSEITGEGRGVPSVDACQNLASLIGQALEKGESASLEIRSYPEAALNLTYHQIQWMD